ncbi:hypothetical protein GH714_000615 [Hevea brasiliensis]|uniref:Uncharacterized protein n=1 Tax=Hevea brasiliensis TaxID=3981 RepID=A0A6A6LZ15_HEVBR|nr:hypothetical protein GH714_000615 [Hevea brasiliensis]
MRLMLQNHGTSVLPDWIVSVVSFSASVLKHQISFASLDETQAGPGSQKLTVKTISTKLKGKKQANSISNAFPPTPYVSTYGYQAFPSTANYISMQPQPHYSHPSCSPLILKTAERNWNNDVTLVEADSNSDSSSGSTESTEALAGCK